MIAAIDIGGTYIKYGLLTEKYELIKKWKKETKLFTTSEQFYDYLCVDLQTISESVSLIGISMPGVLSASFQIISKTSLLLKLLYQTTITKEVCSRCAGLPVFALNDARAAGVCEMQLGMGKGSRSSVYWIIGTGIGGAIFNGTELVKGSNNIAGEFSHIPIEICENQTIGLARKTSIKALVALYNEKASPNQKVSKGSEVARRFHAGEKLALRVLDEWVNYNVQSLLMLIAILDPEIICIGGEVSKDEGIMDLFKKRFYKEISFPFKYLIKTKLETCLFKNDANLIGAAIYAQSKAIALKSGKSENSNHYKTTS